MGVKVKSYPFEVLEEMVPIYLLSTSFPLESYKNASTFVKSFFEELVKNKLSVVGEFK